MINNFLQQTKIRIFSRLKILSGLASRACGILIVLYLLLRRRANIIGLCLKFNDHEFMPKIFSEQVTSKTVCKTGKYCLLRCPLSFDQFKSFNYPCLWKTIIWSNHRICGGHKCVSSGLGWILIIKRLWILHVFQSGKRSIKKIKKNWILSFIFKLTMQNSDF